MLIHGDAFAELAELRPVSVDAIVTDPPYGIGFMQRKWDVFKPDRVALMNHRKRALVDRDETNPNLVGRKRWWGGASVEYDRSRRASLEYQRWTQRWAEAALSALRPGAHVVVCASPRMQHRVAAGLEDAGLEIRDVLVWLHGSGFPKSKQIGPGVGTALKPAYEPIILARAPLDGTIVGTFSEWGTGGINIDACRVEGEIGDGHWSGEDGTDRGSLPGFGGGFTRGGRPYRVSKTDQVQGRTFGRRGYGSTAKGLTDVGRWPANVILDPSSAAMLDASVGTLRSGATPAPAVRGVVLRPRLLRGVRGPADRSAAWPRRGRRRTVPILLLREGVAGRARARLRDSADADGSRARAPGAGERRHGAAGRRGAHERRSQPPSDRQAGRPHAVARAALHASRRPHPRPVHGVGHHGHRVRPRGPRLRRHRPGGGVRGHRPGANPRVDGRRAAVSGGMMRHIEFDNYRFDVTDDFRDPERIGQWVELCMGSQEAVGWAIDKRGEQERMVFYWNEPDGDAFNKFPFKGKAKQVAMLATWWLHDEATYPEQPDHDGSNNRGFRIYNEEWGTHRPRPQRVHGDRADLGDVREVTMITRRPRGAAAREERRADRDQREVLQARPRPHRRRRAAAGGRSDGGVMPREYVPTPEDLVDSLQKCPTPRCPHPRFHGGQCCGPIWPWQNPAGGEERGEGEPEPRRRGEVPYRGSGVVLDPWAEYDHVWCTYDDKPRRVEPGTFPLATGVPKRVDKLRAYGNSIVPACGAYFIRSHMEATGVVDATVLEVRDVEAEDGFLP